MIEVECSECGHTLLVHREPEFCSECQAFDSFELVEEDPPAE